MWHDMVLIAQRDLRIEARSRVALSQIAPFALVVLVMFGFALDPDQGVLEQATPGLYWMTVLFSVLLAVARSGSLDEVPGARDALRLSGLQPAGVFLGKVVAVAVQLLVLQVVLALGVAFFYGTSFTGFGLLLATCGTATAALASSGIFYGSVVAGLGVRHTLLPLLLLPVLAPVLIAATQAFGVALGDTLTNGWAWCSLLGGMTVLYLAVGVLTYGTLMEAS